MSKVICDVCGTTYPETAEQCPICGSARPEDPEIAEQESENTYTYVKGGRFSKGNVRKRNKEKMAAPVVYDQDDFDGDEDDYDEEEPSRSNKGLVIAVVVLLLAIAAVVLYIYFTYLAPQPGKPENTSGTTLPTSQTTGSTQSTDDTQPTVDTTPSTAPSVGGACTGITLTDPEITLSNPGDGYLLNFTLEPADTTDPVTYGSSDPSVATVDENGKITAMGPGNATITITCGSVQTQCTVVCDIETEPTEPTEPPTDPTEPSTEPAAELKLNRKDFTLFNPGETWTLYSGTVAKNLIVFSSDDETIATFVNGVVTYVGPGNVMVHAEYNGQKVSCLVHCRGEATGDVGVEPKPDDTYTSNVLNDDGYLKVGESFVLRLFNSEGEAVKATWTVADSTILSIEGDTIKGLAKGKTTITATAGDQTYTCTITVR